MRVLLLACAAACAGADEGVVLDAGTGDSGACPDECPSPGGLLRGCARRFAHGVNYPWWHFAGDFGGIAAWGQGGVAAERDAHRENLLAMRARGIRVVRWWVFPDFRGDGIVFDDAETPVGLGPSVEADVAEALALAEEAGLHLVPCLFSFDAFRPSEEVAGIFTPGLRPMLGDPARRTALLENVVRPLARAFAAGPHSDRVLAWDVLNEPEWAMSGPSPYGDPDYEPSAGLEAVTHGEMESFLVAVISLLREESRAPISVGSAAFKWRHAWTRLETDFHQFHTYAWVNEYWPYTLLPTHLGLDDKPLVMGEFPLGELEPGLPYAEVVSTWWQNGYAGALAWAFLDASDADLAAVQAFGELHECETTLREATPPPAPVPLPRRAPPSLRRCSAASDGPPQCSTR